MGELKKHQPPMTIDELISTMGFPENWKDMLQNK